MHDMCIPLEFFLCAFEDWELPLHKNRRTFSHSLGREE